MDAFDRDLGYEVQFSNNVEHRVTMLKNNYHDKMEKMEKRLEMFETNYALLLSDRDRLERAFYHMQVWVSERLGCDAIDASPDDNMDVLATIEESQPPEPQGEPSGSQRMDAFDRDLGYEVQFSNNVEHRVTMLKNNYKDKMEKMEKRLEMLETNYALLLSDRDRLERAFYHMQVWVSERLEWDAIDATPDDNIDVLATIKESRPPEPRGEPSGSQ
nr:hypothetical protein [Tanacetum cinerariifolium]